MPNGGPKPDCFHCKHGWNCQAEPIRESTRCQIHQINLTMPIYVFCSKYEDCEADSDYLAGELAPTKTKELESSMMYFWLHSVLKHPSSYGEKNFQHYPLTPMREYDGWTRERVLKEFGERADQLRDEYRKKGYELD
jgi:hypothetical protein